MPPLPGDVQWFPAEIRRLIMAIKKHEGLYNPRHEHFGLRDMQAKAWRSVAHQVGGEKTDSQCRDKWNCLRGTYRRHVRTEATNNVKRRSGWPWAEMMSFIKNYVIEKDELPEPKSSHNGTKSPPSQVKTPVTSSSGAPPGLVFTSNNPQHIIYTNRVIMPKQGQGIGILQPNQGVRLIQHNHQGVQSVGILQTNSNNSIGVRLVRPVQPPLGMTIVRQPSQKSVGIAVKTPEQMKTVNVNVAHTPSSLPNALPIQVDLSKVKPDPDAPKSPDRPEFVDMDIAVKKEPLDIDMDFTEEFNFFSEENSQSSTCENDQNDKESIRKSHDESNSLPSIETNPLEVEADPGEGSGSEVDSNELFMRSTVAHMKQLPPYEQSMFKMKVQQLLHDMMFPQTNQIST